MPGYIGPEAPVAGLQRGFVAGSGQTGRDEEIVEIVLEVDGERLAGIVRALVKLPTVPLVEMVQGAHGIPPVQMEGEAAVPAVEMRKIAAVVAIGPDAVVLAGLQEEGEVKVIKPIAKVVGPHPQEAAIQQVDIGAAGRCKHAGFLPQWHVQRPFALEKSHGKVPAKAVRRLVRNPHVHGAAQPVGP